MLTNTFIQWIKRFHNHINKSTREIFLLLINNCSPHAIKISNKDQQVHIKFFQKNTTSAYQPMDAGLIAMVKKLPLYSPQGPCGSVQGQETLQEMA